MRKSRIRKLKALAGGRLPGMTFVNEDPIAGWNPEAPPARIAYIPSVRRRVKKAYLEAARAGRA